MARSFSLPPEPPAPVAARQFVPVPEPEFSCDYLDVSGLWEGCLGTVMPDGDTVHEYECSYWWSPEGITKTPF